MFHKNLTVCLFGFTLIFSSLFLCCSLQEQYTRDTNTIQQPKYNGIIIPITVPVTAEYRPVISNINMDFSLHMSIDDDGKEKRNSEKISCSGKKRISAVGDRLEWSLTINTMEIENKTFESDIPIVELRFLSDRRGLVDQMELSFPRLIKERVKDIPSPGSDAYDRQIAQYKKMMRVLSAEPVVTGSSLIKQEFKDFIPQLPHKLSGAPSGSWGQIEYVVKGWSYFNDRKVLVTEIAFDKTIKPSSEITVSLSFIGYCLFDAYTFIPLKEDGIFFFEAFESGRRVLFIKGSGQSLSVIE